MPGVIRGAVSTGIFPVSLSTKFTQSNAVILNWNEYADGRTQRTSLVYGGRKSWKKTKRLSIPQLALLSDHWQANRNTAFGFFNPPETSPPFTKNPTGTAGLYTVRYNSDWEDTIGIIRSDTSVELIEVASDTDIVAARYPQGPLATTLGAVTLSVVTAFSQSPAYSAFATVGPTNPNGPEVGYIFSNSGWSVRTDALPLDPASLNPSQYLLYFGIKGTLPGSGTNDLFVYDAFLTIQYASGTTVILRPTTATSQDNQGTVQNAVLAIDGNPSTFAQIERTAFAPLANAPILILSNWR